MTYRVRPFALADSEAVNRLCEWAWWPQRSEAGWDWLSGGAPGAPFTSDMPAGWVCETADGEVLAYLGNFLQRFDWRGETLIGATLHTLLVDPRVKGASRDLLRRFAGQDLPFVRYTFNANDRSAPIYKHFDMHPWPETLSAAKYVWRTDWRGVASERAVRWLNGLAGARGGGERFVDPRVWTGKVRPLRPEVLALDVADIDERFDTLWARLKQDGRLLAARDAESLRWRCADPDLTRTPLLLAHQGEEGLEGYLLAFFSKGSQVERPALEIIDLIATADREAAVIPALVRTLLASARGLGAARVRLPVVNPRMEALLTLFRGARRVYGHDHAHVRWTQGAEPMLSDAWFATPFDGDYSFCLRPPPRIAAEEAA
jgi:hypothetical protein